jgi:hypothetical protein
MSGSNPPVTTSAPELPDLLPVRMVNEFAYCPRLAYLEWAERQDADGIPGTDGREGGAGLGPRHEERAS